MRFHVLVIIIVCIVLVDYFSLAHCPKPPTYHIVVAKFKEDPLWLFHMEQDKLYIYDKSGDKNTPFVPLENKGREGATFLQHIVRYYDNLPDYLVLVQGDPFAHMRSDITPSNFQCRLNQIIDKRPTEALPLFCDPFMEHRMTYAGLMMDKYHQLLFQGKPSDTLLYASGNQYLIPRQVIQRRPKIFYQKLLSMSIQGDHYELNQAHYDQKKFIPTEIIGWSLERIFPTILSETPTNPKFIREQ